MYRISRFVGIEEPILIFRQEYENKDEGVKEYMNEIGDKIHADIMPDMCHVVDLEKKTIDGWMLERRETLVP